MESSETLEVSAEEVFEPPRRRMRIEELPTPPRVPRTFAECETEEEMLALLDEITSKPNWRMG